MLVKEGDVDWSSPINFYLPSKDQKYSTTISLCHLRVFLNLYEGCRIFRNTKLNMDDLIQRLHFIDMFFLFELVLTTIILATL